MKSIRRCEVSKILIADDFYYAYERCFESDEKNHIVAIPAFVNGLFACELYLKCLITKKMLSHNLKELFEALDNVKKNEIRERKIDGLYPLDELLLKIGNGFEVWRYCFENEQKDFEEYFPFALSQFFLENYLPILKEVAHRYDDKEHQ